MPTICVPNRRIGDALADLAATVVEWNGNGDQPEGLSETEFLVPQYALTPWSQTALDQLPHLRCIQLQTAGVEAWLDRIPQGAVLCSGRGIHGGPAAELAVAAILSHLRQLPYFAALQSKSEWDRRLTDGLRGKHVLILGAGDLGHRVAEVVKVFDASATLVARTSRPGIRTISDLPGLVPTANIVVIAMPHTSETRGLVNARFLEALPDGALIVNVARGALLDNKALLQQLTARRIYAFLDVFEHEPLAADDPLWSAPNVIITPHVGGGTSGWEPVAARLVHDQVARYLAGDPLANIVTANY